MAKGGNTKAGVACFDGTDGPAKPKKYQSGQRQGDLSGSTPKGADAGGRNAPRTTTRTLASAPISVPESGSAKARPAGVHVHDGLSAGRAKRSPA